jgi:putative protease
VKILTPFNEQNALEMLVSAGSGEFYMGFYAPEWVQAFGQYSDINRLTLFKETANRCTLYDIPAIVARAHFYQCPLYITLNAPGYSREQKAVLESYLDYLAQCQVDGIIVSVPELVESVISRGMQAVASTMCGIYNEGIARFYADLGVNRIILPRELGTDEIAAVMKAVPEVEYEVFLMRNGCRYSDAYCLGLHGGGCGALCYSLRQGQMQVRTVSAESQISNDDICMMSTETQTIDTDLQGDSSQIQEQELLLWQTHQQFATQYHEFSCGQCAIWRFIQLGVAAVKIVGRLDDVCEVASDVAITKRNIEIAKQCESEKEYLRNMEMPGSLEEYCREGLSCYYPELRF